MRRISNSYHLVDNSPYPITTAISIFSLLLGIILSMQNIELGKYISIISIISIIISSYIWWYDIIVEGTYRGEHTKKVQSGLNLGFILFVISEIMIFFSFFFSYFYNSLVPDINIGSMWPPIGIEVLDFKSVPLLNTALLFFSGLSITCSQNFLISTNKIYSLFYLFFTILLGTIFIYLQYFEYFNALFTISDSVFGSSFFLTTGFHGCHMVIGVFFLLIIFLRFIFNHFTFSHHLGFNFSAIYYHFLDIVWLFLYAVVYCWVSF